MSADFLLYDEKGKLIACVGLTGFPETDVEFAKEMMSHYLGDAEPPYLILIGRDQTYFWRDPVRNREVVGVMPSDALLHHYLGDNRATLADITSSGFEAIVLNWLYDVTQAIDVPELLRAIGLQDAVRHGSVEMTFAA
jgi:hypothetical protein